MNGLLCSARAVVLVTLLVEDNFSNPVSSLLVPRVLVSVSFVDWVDFFRILKLRCI